MHWEQMGQYLKTRRKPDLFYDPLYEIRQQKYLIKWETKLTVLLDFAYKIILVILNIGHNSKNAKNLRNTEIYNGMIGIMK